MPSEVRFKRIDEHAEVTLDELGGLLTDAANVFVTVQGYETAETLESVGETIRLGSLVLIQSLTLYHGVARLIDLSHLIDPVTIKVDDPSLTMDRAKGILEQLAVAYTHEREGQHIKVQRDLYRVVKCIAELIASEYTQDEIDHTEDIVEDFLSRNCR